LRNPLDSLRTAIGGGVCRAVIGVIGGFTMGMIARVVVGEVALGLDGALLGMAFVALGGIVVGVVVAWHLDCRAKAKGALGSQKAAAPKSPTGIQLQA
jgi:hypothetical protein